MDKLPEQWAKTLGGKLAAGLLWRPKRRFWGPNLSQVRKLLLVRVDNRVGEALLMTPLLEALAPHIETDVLVHAKAARVLEGHPRIAELFSLSERNWRLGPFSKTISKLRARRWDVIVNCTNWNAPSVSASLLARWIAPTTPVIGPAWGIAKSLADIAVSQRKDTDAEVLQRLHLLSPLPLSLPSNDNYGMSFRKPQLSLSFESWLSEVSLKPLAIVNPGSRLASRRVPQEVFVHLCEALLTLGRTPLVVWGPGEEGLARALVEATEGSLLAPATNLDELAALMQRAQCTITNNTGPMHLSVAVGAPTLSLFYGMSVERWGHGFSPHLCVDLTPKQDNGVAMAKLAVQALRRFYEGLK